MWILAYDCGILYTHNNIAENFQDEIDSLLNFLRVPAISSFGIPQLKSKQVGSTE